jgi:glycine/D-amino acid oxidase-like deaminating enzyme
MHFDVICVGAGALGTFHAYFAAKKGKKVLLVERDFTPYEGTVRNFGQCVASGQEIPLWRERGIKALKTYKAIQAKTDITLRNNGTCYIASDDAEMRLLEEMHQYNMETDAIPPGF